jgi:hypothetical protein
MSRKKSSKPKIAEFFVPEKRLLPACCVRSIKESDFEVCEEIYRRNEPTHFPSGYFGKFKTFLKEHEPCF